VFSLEEANALIPRLKQLVGRQLERQFEIEARLRSLARCLGHIPESLQIADKDSLEVQIIKQDIAERIRVFEKDWQPVSSLGGVVKDSRLGLIDFLGLLEGRFVWLCWRYGEDRVNFFQELDQGFSARKRIEPGVQQKLLN
jgi:hypothetical protein